MCSQCVQYISCGSKEKANPQVQWFQPKSQLKVYSKYKNLSWQVRWTYEWKKTKNIFMRDFFFMIIFLEWSERKSFSHTFLCVWKPVESTFFLFVCFCYTHLDHKRLKLNMLLILPFALSFSSASKVKV